MWPAVRSTSSSVNGSGRVKGWKGGWFAWMDGSWTGQRVASVVLIISREPAPFLSSPSVRLLSKHFDLCAAVPSPFPDKDKSTPAALPARRSFVALVNAHNPAHHLGLCKFSYSTTLPPSPSSSPSHPLPCFRSVYTSIRLSLSSSVLQPLQLSWPESSTRCT